MAVKYLSVFLLLDLLVYSIHRLLHAVPDGWRVHALHHSDEKIDLTTAVRHHPIEHIVGAAAYGSVAAFLPPTAVLAHGVVLFATNLLCHTRLRFPPAIERALGLIVITPQMHRVHHSINPHHASHNFGGVLSIWDLLLGTSLRLNQEEAGQLRFGVREVHQHDGTRLSSMLALPWTLGPFWAETHQLDDWFTLELSISSGERKIRLRANLVEDGRIAYAHAADYPNLPHRFGRQIGEFTRELEEVAQRPMPRPLFRF